MKKPYDEMVKSIRFYRTVTVLLIGCIIYIGINNISSTQAADKYKAKCNYLENSIQLIVTKSKQDQQIRIDELEEANSALIQVCNPSQFRKAASKSLPKLKKV